MNKKPIYRMPETAVHEFVCKSSMLVDSNLNFTGLSVEDVTTGDSIDLD